MKSKKQNSGLSKSVFSLLFFVLLFVVFILESACKTSQLNEPTQNQKLKIFSIYDPPSDFNGLAVFYPREIVITNQNYNISFPIKIVNTTDNLVFLNRFMGWILFFEAETVRFNSLPLSGCFILPCGPQFMKIDKRSEKLKKYDSVFNPLSNSFHVYKFGEDLSKNIFHIKKGNRSLRDIKMKIKISNININAYSTMMKPVWWTNLEFNIRVTVDPNRKVTQEDQLNAFKAVIDELVKKGRIKHEEGEKIKKGGTSFDFIQVCPDIKELENNK